MMPPASRMPPGSSVVRQPLRQVDEYRGDEVGDDEGKRSPATAGRVPVADLEPVGEAVPIGVVAGCFTANGSVS